jgi:hypothetical protein
MPLATYAHIPDPDRDRDRNRDRDPDPDRDQDEKKHHDDADEKKEARHRPKYSEIKYQYPGGHGSRSSAETYGRIKAAFEPDAQTQIRATADYLHSLRIKLGKPKPDIPYAECPIPIPSTYIPSYMKEEEKKAGSAKPSPSPPLSMSMSNTCTPELMDAVRAEIFRTMTRTLGPATHHIQSYNELLAVWPRIVRDQKPIILCSGDSKSHEDSSSVDVIKIVDASLTMATARHSIDRIGRTITVGEAAETKTPWSADVVVTFLHLVFTRPAKWPTQMTPAALSTL